MSRSQSQSGEVIPFIFLAILAGLSSVLTLGVSHLPVWATTPYEFGRLLGAILFVGVIVTTVLWLVGAGIYALMRQSHYWTLAKGAALFTVIVAASLVLSVVAPMAGVNRPIFTLGPSQEDTRIAAQVSERFRVEVLQAAQTYTEQQRAVGALAIFGPESLRHGLDLRDALARVRQARALMAASNQTMAKLEQDYRQGIQNSAITPSSKRQFLAGMERGFVKGRVARAQRMDVQSRMLDHIEANLDLLQRHPAAWRVQNGRLGFTDRAVLQAFNQNIRSNQALSAEDRAAANQAVSKLNAGVQHLNALAGATP